MVHKHYVFIFCCFVFVLSLLFGLLYSNSQNPNEKHLAVADEAEDEDAEPILRPLALSDIFSEDRSSVNSLPQQHIRTVIATGDVLLARTVNFKNTTSGNFQWPFEKTAEVLKSSDITFINLETPLISNCPLSNEGFTFCGDLKNIEGLQFAGVDVINIANNHAGNFGREGVEETVTRLGNAGFDVVGVSGPVYKNVRGITFAFLGYNEVDMQPGVSYADKETLVREITEAKKMADVVIVQFHWGSEYTTSITTSQRELGKLAIDSGADLVIGNHPHWVQPIEVYNNKLITYAHGNFIFDQEWSRETKTGVVGRYTFYKDTLVDAEFLPVRIEQFGQPYFLSGVEKDEVIDSLKQESEALSIL